MSTLTRATRVETGYPQYGSVVGKYRGDRNLSIPDLEVTAHFDLKSYVRHHLMNLHRETGHTCHLGIRNGNVGFYLDKIESDDYGINLLSEVGRSFPLHCTTMGKVLLALMDHRESRKILSRKLESHPSQTITDPSILEKELQQVPRARVRRRSWGDHARHYVRFSSRLYPRRGHRSCHQPHFSLLHQ